MASFTAAPQPSPPTPSASVATSSFCAPGSCTPYCPPWYCPYYTGPPPPMFSDSPDSSSSRVSPLMLALISILAAAFLLLAYYTFASKFRRRRRSRDIADEERQLQARLDQLVLQDSAPASVHIAPAAAVNSNGGLDEQFIKSITVFKYKRGDGLVESTDCAVCLTEFKEEESLRLMPNCQHAFHLPCIDTWLRSHSNCPICRTSMIGPPPPPPPPPPPRPPPRRQSTAPSSVVLSRMRVQRGGDVVVVVDGGSRDRVSVHSEIGFDGRNSDQRHPVSVAPTATAEGEVVGVKSLNGVE